MGQALLHVEGNVNGDLDEEGHCQPANHGIPPEQEQAVGQEDPHRHIGRGHVSCMHANCHKGSLQPLHATSMLCYFDMNFCRHPMPSKHRQQE